MMKLFSKNSNLCDHNIPTLQRDRQTDKQTTCDRNTALCTKVHRAVKIRKFTKSGLLYSVVDTIHKLSIERPHLIINVQRAILIWQFHQSLCSFWTCWCCARTVKLVEILLPSSVTWPFDTPYAISYWWSFGTKPLSLTVSEIFNGECDAMVECQLTLSRHSTIASHSPLNWHDL